MLPPFPRNAPGRIKLCHPQGQSTHHTLWGMPSLPGPTFSMLQDVFSPPRRSTNTLRSFVSGSASGGAPTKTPTTDHHSLCNGRDWLGLLFLPPWLSSARISSGEGPHWQ